MRTWEHIYETNAAKLKGVCRRYVKSDDIAEDIMHDAFEIAMQKAGSYSGKGSFDGWLYKITVNTALQYLRNNKKTINKTDDLLDYHLNKEREEVNITESKKSRVHQAKFEVSDLLEAIDLLPEHHKIVFNLYVLEKKSHKEISEMLAISINTSKSHLNRARKKLQDILYYKAKDKERDGLKKYLLLLFPFYFSIDGIYASQFKDYRVNPSVSGIEFSNVSVIDNKKYNYFNKIAALTVFILGSLIYFLNSKNNNQTYKTKELKELIKINDLDLTNILKEVDSLFYIKGIEENKKSGKSEIANHKNKQVLIKVPVVVRKQIIIKDTIVE